MLSLAELAALGFAGYRATQLIVHDSLLDPARDRLFAWHGRDTESSLRSALVTLVSCTYCVGWWLSGAILTTYLFAAGRWHQAPLLVHGIEWLAVAGGQALLNRADDTMGITQ